MTLRVSEQTGQLKVLPDPSGLLAAIMTNYEETTPRMMYADWLDEQGDPDKTLRAEYIRKWCTPAPDAGDYAYTCDWAAAHVAHYARIRELYEVCFEGTFLHARTWMDRGFVRTVFCPWWWWCNFGEKVRESEWIPHVVLTSGPQSVELVSNRVSPRRRAYKVHPYVHRDEHIVADAPPYGGPDGYNGYLEHNRNWDGFHDLALSAIEVVFPGTLFEFGAAP